MSRSVSSLLIMCCLLGSSWAEPETGMKASSLKRKDLPNEFPFQVLDVGVAVIRLEIRNRSGSDLKLNLEELRVTGPGGKKLQRLVPTEVTPKLMKYYRGGQRGFGGEVYAGGRPRPGSPVPTVEPTAGAGSVSIDVAQRLRAILEHYELQEGTVPAGESLEGFLYVKSQKSGTQLTGGRVSCEEWSAVIE